MCLRVESAGNLLGLGEFESPASYPYGHPKFSSVMSLVWLKFGWLVGNPSKIATGWSFFWLAIGWLQKILLNRLTTLTNWVRIEPWCWVLDKRVRNLRELSHLIIKACPLTSKFSFLKAELRVSPLDHVIYTRLPKRVCSIAYHVALTIKKNFIRGNNKGR